MKTSGDSGRSFAAQPPGNPGIKTPRRLRRRPEGLVSRMNVAGNPRSTRVACRAARRADGQVEVGGAEVTEQAGEAAGADEGQTPGGLLYPGGPVTDRPIHSGPELMGATSARHQPCEVVEYGQGGLISPDRTALAAGGAIDKICDLALDHRRSFGC
jgi:hypothetical protein